MPVAAGCGALSATACVRDGRQVMRRCSAWRVVARPPSAYGMPSYHRNTSDESERRVVDHLREYGTISSQTVQNLLLVGIQQASVVLRSLAERGVIQRTADSPTRRPSVRYEPGSAFPTRKRRHWPESSRRRFLYPETGGAGTAAERSGRSRRLVGHDPGIYRVFVSSDRKHDSIRSSSRVLRAAHGVEGAQVRISLKRQ